MKWVIPRGWRAAAEHDCASFTPRTVREVPVILRDSEGSPVRRATGERNGRSFGVPQDDRLGILLGPLTNDPSRPSDRRPRPVARRPRGGVRGGPPGGRGVPPAPAGRPPVVVV